jgi:tRNA-binding protein
MTPAQVKPPILPELLDQIDIRVGTIESVSDVANSEKLVALRVNFGDHVRTVMAGMKRERTNPREIEGKQALFVVNLPPRKMAGMVVVGYFEIVCRNSTTAVRTTKRPITPMPRRYKGNHSIVTIFMNGQFLIHVELLRYSDLA